MNIVRRGAKSALALLTLVGCSAALQGNSDALKDLTRDFGTRCEFSIVDRSYLLAKRKDDTCPGRQEAVAILMVARFENGQEASPRASSRIGPVNFEDSSGAFCFQLAWDSEARKVLTGSVEYY